MAGAFPGARNLSRRISGWCWGGIDFYPKKTIATLTDVIRRFYENWDQEKYRHYLQLFAIDESKRVDQLSSGMQVKYMIALALSHNARLLILDEPVTGLDPAAAQDLYRTLAYLNKSEGIAIVMVTHDMENALRYADFILHAGQRQHFFGTVQEYLSSPMGRRFGGESA